MADADAMKREAARHIEAQIASTSLDPEPPDNRKKVTTRFPLKRIEPRHPMWVTLKCLLNHSSGYYTRPISRTHFHNFYSDQSS